MSALEYERQNNARLDQLASKVSALRGVTVDIYDHARDQRLLDDNNEAFAGLSTSLRSSAGRLRTMANNPSRVQVLRFAAMLSGAIIVVWLLWGSLFGGGGGSEPPREADGAKMA